MGTAGVFVFFTRLCRRHAVALGITRAALYRQNGAFSNRVWCKVPYSTVVCGVPRTFQLPYEATSTRSLTTNNDDNQSTHQSPQQAHWQNTFITASRAMEDYLLDTEDLKGLHTRTIRSAEDNAWSPKSITCYLKADIEKRALSVWGSWSVLDKHLEQKRAKDEEDERKRNSLSAIISFQKKLKKDLSRIEANAQAFGGKKERLKGSARVVLFALLSNTAVLVFKLLAYLYTGSGAMLSEAIHSLADVLNQCLLAFGIAQSIRKPDPSHPYGFSRARYVYSLISGVSIFTLGAGVTVYHGISGLLHPPTLEYLAAGFAVLTGSLLVEGATLITAIKQVQLSATESKMSFKDYVLRGRDPTAVAVLLEDSAAVAGIVLCSTCLGLVYYTGNPVYDSIGSITIGGLLGAVAMFLIRRNSSSLVGRSIPYEQLKHIQNLLEGDITVRSIHDIKATDLGSDNVRFKAEVNFDGREVARKHVNKLDLEALLMEVNSFTTVAELEKFILEHGEHVVDILGAEVDRMERSIKAHHPEVRHVDLEIL